jgi:4,5-DOPA dioxygenase extradiol
MTADPSVPGMPVLFVGHGNPMNAILDNKWSRGFKALGQRIPRPKAILCISAHWYIPGTFLTGNHDPQTIHDFGGFPQELYEVTYAAPGDPGLADRVSHMLSKWNACARTDWGLDHGTWTVLRHMWPQADIPVVQLSIDGRAPPEQHLAMGRALAPLSEQGVFILGSGNLVHNLGSALRQMRVGTAALEPWATEFDDRVSSALESGDAPKLVHACDDSVGHLAHPSPDHFLPILYTSGAAGEGRQVEFPLEGFDLGTISMRAVLYK